MNLQNKNTMKITFTMFYYEISSVKIQCHGYHKIVIRLVTIEKALSIKFPFIRDLGIGSNSSCHCSHYFSRENDPIKKRILQYEIT